MAARRWTRWATRNSSARWRSSSTPRTATVITLEETELVEIDKAQFYILVRQNPHFALQLMQLLSERLRNADTRYLRSRTEMKA